MHYDTSSPGRPPPRNGIQQDQILQKLMTRLKRSAEEDHISIGKEYITRLGKRSYWISPLARHWMLIKQRIMKKEKKI